MGLLQLLHELQQAGVWRQHADVGGFRRTANPAFLALFSTVISSLYTILQDSSIASYIALQTVVQISAAIIFLSGIFAGGWNISTGIRNQKKKKISRSYQWYWYPGLVLPGRLIGLVEGPPSSLQTVSKTRGLSYTTRKLRWENMEQPGL